MTDADKAEMDEATDRAMEMTNAELAELDASLNSVMEVAEILKKDSLSLAEMDSIWHVVKWKAYQQRHPYIWWLKPVSISGAAAARLPNEGSVTDYLFELKSEWNPVSVSFMYEREDGEYYYGYSLNGERGLFFGLDIQVRTQIKTAKNVDRQSVVIGRKFTRKTGFFEDAWGGIGVGAVTRHYSKPKVAIDLSMSMPGGRLIYTTDFKNIHIWDAETQFGFHLTDNTLLIAVGKYFGDGDKMFWAIKGGVEIKLQ